MGGHNGFPLAMAGAVDSESAITTAASNSSVLFTVKLLVEVELAP